MRNAILLLLATVLCACSAPPPQPTDEELAATAACTAYQSLYGGRTEVFLHARAGAEGHTPQYAEQLLAACNQHVASVKRLHGGVSQVNVSRVVADSTLHLMQVFLLLSYGDSTQEEMVVPMVKESGEWKMK